MLIAQTAQGGLSNIDFAVIAVYLAAMLAMGLYIALRQKSTEDFFLGGRNLPAWAVGISLLASLLSTITYLGMPGEMFRTGLSFLTRQLGVPVVLIIVWFVWLPFFMKLNLTSAYEYLERRFNYATRAIAAAFCILMLLGWMSVVVLTASKAMVEIADLDLGWFFGINGEFRDADIQAIIAGIGLFSVLYTMLGGIRAVVWTDVVQFFVLVSGALFTMGYVMWETDSGITQWVATAREYPYRESVEWYSFDIGNRSTILFISIGMFFWSTCTHGANQVALQRYFSVRNIWAARRSFLVNALASFGLGLVLAGVGLALIHFMETHPLPASENVYHDTQSVRYEAQDKVFPQFIRMYLPDGLRGMVVAALFAAAMSTIDSGANSISTIATVDFFRPLRNTAASPGSELRLARILTGTMGLIVVACTIFLYHISKGTDIISLCQKGFNCFLGPLGGLFMLALFFPRVSARSAIPAVFAGEVAGVLTSYSQELFGFNFSTHLVIGTAWLVTIVTGYLLSFVVGEVATADQRRWTWKPVVWPAPNSVHDETLAVGE